MNTILNLKYRLKEEKNYMIKIKNSIFTITFIIILCSSVVVNAEIQIEDQKIAEELINKYNFTEEDLKILTDNGCSLNILLETEHRGENLSKLPKNIKDAPYSAMISADKQEQRAYINHIDNFSISEEDKKYLKEGLTTIWSKNYSEISRSDYPILQKYGDLLEEMIGIKRLEYEKSQKETTNNTITPKWEDKVIRNVQGTSAGYNLYKVSVAIIETFMTWFWKIPTIQIF